MKFTGSLLLLGLAGLAAPLHAQATQIVKLQGTSFTPNNIVITKGDTVTFDWVMGLHNVTSGTVGSPDGNFNSGAATSNSATLFSVVFDAAFLAAKPMPNNDYPFFCIVHGGFGMTGKVHVKLPPLISNLGCGINPVGSILSLAGSPAINSVWTVGLTNPVGTQAPGSLAFLAISAGPSPGTPCGIPLPGLGMSAAGAPGELLLDISPGALLPLIGPALWTGAPSAFPLALPNSVSLIGAPLFLQGAMLDLVAASGVSLALTDGLKATIGEL